MELNVLGTVYTIEKKAYSDDECLEKNSYCGYCNDYEKKIVICDMKTAPGWSDDSPDAIKAFEEETMRHEIVHAFLNESGLKSNALSSDGAWSKNEEMVDWIATQGPKIMEAWRKAGCL